MASNLSRRFRHFAGLLGLLAAMAALVGQLALGAVLRPDDAAQAQRAALDAVNILCQPGTANHQAPRHRHAAKPVLCPLSAAFAHSDALLTPSTVVPVPSAALSFRSTRRPPSRAPPARVFTAAYPRGPPRLV